MAPHHDAPERPVLDGHRRVEDRAHARRAQRATRSSRPVIDARYSRISPYDCGTIADGSSTASATRPISRVYRSASASDNRPAYARYATTNDSTSTAWIQSNRSGSSARYAQPGHGIDPVNARCAPRARARRPPRRPPRRRTWWRTRTLWSGEADAHGSGLVRAVLGDPGHRTGFERLDQERAHPAGEHRRVGMQTPHHAVRAEPASGRRVLHRDGITATSNLRPRPLFDHHGLHHVADLRVDCATSMPSTT